MEPRGRKQHRWANREVEWSFWEKRHRRQSARVAARERGTRTSFKCAGAHESKRGQRTSFKIGCCNFCKGLFLKAGWRWVDRN